MSFRRFVLVRLAWALLGLWLAATVVFLLFFVPVDLGREACGGERAAPACVERVRKELHLGAPLYEQYVVFLWRLGTEQSAGPLVLVEEGEVRRVESGSLALNALPATASVVVAGLALALAVAGLAGIGLARTRRRRIFDFPIYIAFGLTPIVVGILLSYHVGVQADLLPIANYCDFFNPPKEVGCGGAVDWSKHLVLPAVTLSLYFAAVYTRVVRALALRVRSEKEREERRKRRRRAVLLVVRGVGRDFGLAISIAIFVEAVFYIPGLGRSAVTSIYAGSLVELQSYVLYATFLALAVHFVVDVVVAALDNDLRWERPAARIPKRA